MPRAALSQVEVDEFRDALCESATRLFAEHGYEGVTMRALASDLGCSPMTPYRYFENKAEIFDAVRAQAFGRFADALEAADRPGDSPRARLEALVRAYVRFAQDEPHGYRIMFELDQPSPPRPPDHESRRSWRHLHRAVAEGVRCGLLEGDPDVLAHLHWSALHGLVALHLAGMLQLGRRLEELTDAWIERELGAPPPREE